MHGREARGTAVADAINADGGEARFVAADLSGTPGQTIYSSRPARSTSWVNNAGVAWTGPPRSSTWPPSISSSPPRSS